MNDLELMDLRVAALFTHDADGRIVTNNEPEPDPGPAPRSSWGGRGRDTFGVFAMMSPRRLPRS